MFYLKSYSNNKVIQDIDQEFSITLDAQSKYVIEEGLCSLIIADRPMLVHWFHKVDPGKLVNAHKVDSDCIINTAHPCLLINNTDEKIKFVIKNLNNVIESYKKSLDKQQVKSYNSKQYGE